MKKMIQQPQEYRELVEIFDVLNQCRHFRYDEAIQEQALARCENPELINLMIQRLGLQVSLPTALLREMLVEAAGEMESPIILGELLMEYWLKDQARKGKPILISSIQERLLIREFFIYFLKFKHVEKDLSILKFHSPWKWGNLICT